MQTTILLSNYNGEEVLDQTLDRFMRQTKKPDHIYIIDDCSTDNSIAILSEFEARANCKITFYRNKEKMGHSHNFMSHFGQTDGDLVFFATQNDFWWPNKIKEFYDVVNFDPFLGLLFSNTELINKRGELVDRDHFSVLRLMDKWDNTSPDLGKYFWKNQTFIDASLLMVSAKVRKKYNQFFEAYPNYELPYSFEEFLTRFIALSFPGDFVREILKVLIRQRVSDDSPKLKKNRKKETKQDRTLLLQQDINSLENYLGLAILIDKNHDKKESIQKALLHQQNRLKNRSSSSFSKLVFAFSQLISGSYLTRNQFPIKEFIRDLS